MKNNKKVAVVGLGYVGLPLALLAESKDYSVVGIDIDKDKISLLSDKKSPFTDEDIQKNLSKAENITFTDDFSKVQETETVIICVPTPVHEDCMPNLKPVEASAVGIAPFIKSGHLVILESTVNPGVSEGVVIPIIEEKSGLKAGKDFYFAHCPERINPGDKDWNVGNINRVVGSLEEAGLEKAVEFYESIITGSVKRMGSLKEAEAVKIVENSFRDINIAFVNELARSFTKLGIDVVRVIDGAATKPFAFMAHYPGCGVGGHCIPVDPYYLIEYAKKNGFTHEFLSLARKINNGMPDFTVSELEKALESRSRAIEGAEIALLGISYKPNIGDYRESPSLEIWDILKEKGAKVRAFDPHVLDKSTVQSLDEALQGVKAVVVATGHDEFKSIDLEKLVKCGVEVVVDGRNCLDSEKVKEAGMVYKGIGRG